jgi:hypothetical protein
MKSYYFSHDYNARNDEKILKLIQKEGWEGYGLYWALIEKLYEAGGFLDEDYDCISYDLRTQSERIKDVVNNYKLFVVASKKIHSKSCLARLIALKGKSEKARQSAIFRWDKIKNKDTNAKRTQSECYAINKIKENKIKENIAKEIQVIPNLLNDTQKHIQIIGLFVRAKGITFSNKEEQSSFIRRNLKAAQNLKPYPFDKIANTMKYLMDNADFKWTIESVAKYIDEDLTKIKNIGQKEEDVIKSILNK